MKTIRQHILNVAAIFALAVPALAIDMRDDYNVTGTMNFDTPFRIENDAVTNTAANLNKAVAAPAQMDTNQTTTATTYTPRFRGDILFGYTGATGTVWIAGGTNAIPTTNDWFAYTVPFPAGGTMAGAFVAGSLATTGMVTHAGSAKTITNAAAIASGTARILTVSAVTASTNTLPAPAAAGQLLTVVNVGTNVVVFAAGGNIQTTNAVTLARRYKQDFWAETATNWIPFSSTVNN